MLLETELRSSERAARAVSPAPFKLILKLSEISLVYLRGLLIVFLLVPFGEEYISLHQYDSALINEI